SCRPNPQRSGRVLCLRLRELPSPGFKRCPRSGSMRTVAEAFLKYSPRVSFRPDAEGGFFIFIDIASTSHLFADTARGRRNEAMPRIHGEEGLMRSATSLARDLGLGV